MEHLEVRLEEVGHGDAENEGQQHPDRRADAVSPSGVEHNHQSNDGGADEGDHSGEDGVVDQVGDAAEEANHLAKKGDDQKVRVVLRRQHLRNRVSLLLLLDRDRVIVLEKGFGLPASHNLYFENGGKFGSTKVT